ncbi:cytidylate kinase [Sporobacter termitidis DSM 10068]|uniref:Cytidylate kinase n=1 Tax=Sporobacter termitidis DSM 10068 TaxID=1123282 RepID=A0A1M5TJ98_9FIRM|nr:(d)CMP kinase [Sporobacter termitidis]SHH50758.1 cytidylate kinase [Sporobacter termitidis DSM 10068]
MEERSIAIDGPSGAGKSTLARLTAKKYGLIYVDTGALYRSVGLFALQRGVSSKDEENVVKLLPDIRIELRYDGGGLQRMFLNGKDVTENIRVPEASIYASDVSSMVPVRDFLLAMQREMAVKYDVVMDGRDIGTVVLPDAGLKIFLTARPEVRAERRYAELKAKSISTTYDEVLRDILYRDKNDSERSAAPLKAAEDAILVDTSEMDLEQCLKAICALAEEKLGL